MTELFINMFLKKPISTLETLLTEIGTSVIESENPMICPDFDTVSRVSAPTKAKK